MDGSNIEVNNTFHIKNLTKIYGDKVAVNNINLELAEGEFLSLLGPSGSGKTTLLRMISGLITPDKGEIYHGGKYLNTIPPNKRNFGMVFQQYALFPHMTVWDNVAYGLRAKKVDKQTMKEKVEKYLALVDLTHLAKRKPKQLSGGQQQRVSLARALTVEPTLLLFDEPLSNLDARLKDQMLTEIRNLHKRLKFTAIYVTHDQNEALYLSDKIAVLKDGNLKQVGTPNEILSAPHSPFVADFFGYTNTIKQVGVKDKSTVEKDGISIPVGKGIQNCSKGTVGSVYIRPNAITIPEFSGTKDGQFNTHAEAKITDLRLLGGSTEIRLQLLDEETILTANVPYVLQPESEMKKIVSLQFNKNSVVFFADQEGES